MKPRAGPSSVAGTTPIGTPSVAALSDAGRRKKYAFTAAAKTTAAATSRARTLRAARRSSACAFERPSNDIDLSGDPPGDAAPRSPRTNSGSRSRRARVPFASLVALVWNVVQSLIANRPITTG